MKGVEVVKSTELTKAGSTSGVVRGKAFETPTLLHAQSKIAGGVVSGWHHHGKRDLYGYLVSGRLRIEVAEGDAADLYAGDFFHIPPRLVHRDVNPDAKEEACVVNVMVGGGPAFFNVDEPTTGAKKPPKGRR